MNATEDTMSPEESASTRSCEVSWPTVFFWIVCFALNTMSQPTGRILGLSYRYPSILRSSPIAYAFDAINVLVSWRILVVYSRLPGRLAATQILKDRMTDTKDQTLHAIRSLKEQSKVRWIGFVLGVLPQAIKLFATRGMPWTQALGALYLASWLLFELVILASLSDDTLSYLPHILEEKEKSARKYLATIGVLFNSVVYTMPSWMVWSSARPSARSFIPWTDLRFQLVFGLTCMPVILLLSLAPLRTDVIIDFYGDSNRGNGDISWGVEFNTALTPNLCVPLFLTITSDMSDTESTTLSMLLQGSVAMLLFLGLLRRRLLGSSWMRTHLDMCSTLFCFVCPLLYYSVIYDSTGTCMPEWLQWFG
jgi:hypothetical protein